MPHKHTFLLLIAEVTPGGTTSGSAHLTDLSVAEHPLVDHVVHQPRGAMALRHTAALLPASSSIPLSWQLIQELKVWSCAIGYSNASVDRKWEVGKKYKTESTFGAGGWEGARRAVVRFGYEKCMWRMTGDRRGSELLVLVWTVKTFKSSFGVRKVKTNPSFWKIYYLDSHLRYLLLCSGVVINVCGNFSLRNIWVV
jgi:hypothetical protein